MECIKKKDISSGLCTGQILGFNFVRIELNYPVLNPRVPMEAVTAIRIMLHDESQINFVQLQKSGLQSLALTFHTMRKLSSY